MRGVCVCVCVCVCVTHSLTHSHPHTYTQSLRMCRTFWTCASTVSRPSNPAAMLSSNAASTAWLTT